MVNVLGWIGTVFILLGYYLICNGKHIKGKKYINRIIGYGNDCLQGYIINKS